MNKIPLISKRNHCNFVCFQRKLLRFVQNDALCTQIGTFSSTFRSGWFHFRGLTKGGGQLLPGLRRPGRRESIAARVVGPGNVADKLGQPHRVRVLDKPESVRRIVEFAFFSSACSYFLSACTNSLEPPAICMEIHESTLMIKNLQGF